MIYRRRWLVLLTVLVLTAYFIVSGVQASLPEPGGEGDPLVTKSYVDNYIEARYLELQEQLEALSAQVTVLENRVQELKESIKPKIVLTIGKKTAYIGMQPKELLVAPFTKGGRTMVPFRFVGEALGAAIGWEPSTRTVSYRRDGATLELKINSHQARFNGQEIKLDTAPLLVEGSTMVPVRVVSEFFGATVVWDGKTQTVTITP
ncbi:stalk domain-containing protein [Calderihabitans maritimus]|uniref:Flagellin and related hook-associated proteins n=1 Tax=Calderihabitans maritimus TaxID=1246530 RepID=A0A1Z5HWZ1_9FIRM|nr:stalk domain-containing protein [Calderihabitans maritimus]GAW93851.1 flagellin and related hook-associated proteins [Calderihabitans maritimus]